MNEKSIIRQTNKRIIVVTGHYGSGKTEFSVSWALKMSEEQDRPYPRLSVVDLDIVNPYFRSRERMDVMEKAGIKVYGGIYKTEITAELPELAADIRAPLEDKGCRVIVDAGGNDSGAKVLNQFRKYFTPDETAVIAVINANRPDTRDVEGAISHLSAIEATTGLKIEGIVNNTHLLRETTADTIIKGHKLCLEVCRETGKELWCDCYPASLVPESALTGVGEYLMPLGLYMRPSWLDK